MRRVNPGPNPVDIRVGNQMREIRIRRGFTQQDLADALGVSFQQVQKYERGANRMGASRLVQVASSLQCSIEDLFEGIEGSKLSEEAPLDRDAAKVARDWARLPDANTRAIFRDLMQKMAQATAS